MLFHVIENGKMIKKTESRQEMRQEMCIHPRTLKTDTSHPVCRYNGWFIGRCFTAFTSLNSGCRNATESRPCRSGADSNSPNTGVKTDGGIRFKRNSFTDILKMLLLQHIGKVYPKGKLQEHFKGVWVCRGGIGRMNLEVRCRNWH